MMLFGEVSDFLTTRLTEFEVETDQTAPDLVIPSQNGPLVLDVLIEYLREIFLASLSDLRTFHWPDDLGDRPCRNRYSFEDLSMFDLFSRDLEVKRHRCFALSALQAVNSVDRRAHLSARRALGHSLAFDMGYWMTKSNMDEFRLLDTHTRVLEIRNRSRRLLLDRQDEEREGRCATFFRILSQKAPSLRVLQLSFEDAASARQIFKVILGSISSVEELCLLVFSGTADSDMLADIFELKPDVGEIPDCDALHTIRLQHFPISNLLKTRRGLPIQLFPLHRFKSLLNVHVYDPFRTNRPNYRQSNADTCLRKLTWMREDVDKDFVFESAWLRELDFCSAMPEEFRKFLSTSPHMTIDVPYDATPDTAPVIAQVGASLRTMTIFTDDFPTLELLLQLPPSLELLVIRFEAKRCRADPPFLVKRLCKFVESRGAKVLRLCIGASLNGNGRREGGGFRHSGPSQPDSSLFAKTRDACNAHGYQFM